MQLPDEIREEAEALVAQIEGCPAAELQCDPLAGGANNQVFLVESPAARYCLKWYFSHPDDPRDRLRQEWEFSRYAWSKGITNIPRPLAASPARNLGVYQFIEGTKLASDQLNPAHVDQAVELVCRLNRERDSREASQLLPASEACLRWEDHIAHVDRRLHQFANLEAKSEFHIEAGRFVNDRLLPAWDGVRSATLDAMAESELRFDAESEHALEVISPSDFGFHNALLAAEGDLYFLDFEYAGWDSLVKLICDFFHQPEVPVPREHLGRVLDEISTRLSIPHAFVDPIRRFLPVYGMKWCCILLNEFLPTGQSRRCFSQAKPATPEQLRAQLGKARRKLDSLFAADD